MRRSRMSSIGSLPAVGRHRTHAAGVQLPTWRASTGRSRSKAYGGSARGQDLWLEPRSPSPGRWRSTTSWFETNTMADRLTGGGEQGGVIRHRREDRCLVLAENELRHSGDLVRLTPPLRPA